MFLLLPLGSVPINFTLNCDAPYNPDETDPAFWKQMTDYGWDYLNHTAERTEERYGEWYPLLIDKVVTPLSVTVLHNRSVLVKNCRECLSSRDVTSLPIFQVGFIWCVSRWPALDTVPMNLRLISFLKYL